NNDKGSFPSISRRNERDGQWRRQRTYRSTRIRSTCSKPAVFLGEELRRCLDRGRKVTRFTDSKNESSKNKQRHADRNPGAYVANRTDKLLRLLEPHKPMACQDTRGSYPTKGVDTGADRPNGN